MRILVIYDVPSWAYHRRALALQKYAPDDFDVDIVGVHGVDWPSVSRYQLVYLLDYTAAGGARKRLRKHSSDTILVVSHNRDSKSRLEFFPMSYKPADFLVINNRECFEAHDRLERTCNISNGIDLDVWKCERPIMDRPKRVIWCGSASVKKGKGYQDVLLPLSKQLRELGYETDFRAFVTGDLQKWAYPTEKQLEWYNGAAIAVCASKAEGTPNYLLEAAACGCVPVTSRVGNVLEYGKDGENCVTSERDASYMASAVEYAWEHRERMSAAAKDTMGQWGYDKRAAYFYGLFRALIEGRAVKPFTWMEVSPDEIGN